MKLFWTKEALLCLEEIEDYISNDNQIAAAEFIDKLIEATETICDNQEIGRIVPELSFENIRELIHKNYRIVYLVKKNSIEVLTVFEGHKLLNKNNIIKKV